MSLSGGVIRRPICRGLDRAPQFKMCYPYEVIRDLGTFFQPH